VSLEFGRQCCDEPAALLVRKETPNGNLVSWRRNASQPLAPDTELAHVTFTRSI
jgi:hypothetical protein